MKRVLILTRFRGEYEPTRLKIEAQLLGYEVDVVNYEKVRIAVDKNLNVVVDLGTGFDLSTYTRIIMRAASAKGKASMIWKKTVITEILSLKKTNGVLNLATFARYPLMGKLEQGVLLATAGLKVVPFDSFDAHSWKTILENQAEFPVFLKGRFGSHGKQVRLVNNKDSLMRRSKIFKSGTVLMQKVLKVRRWYRVLVLNGEVLGVMKHKQKAKYIPEIYKEEISNIVPNLSDREMEKLKEISKQAVKVFDIEYAGLDIAWDEESKDWVIWEINRTAQFKWFEKANPEINVAKKLLG